MRERRGLDTSRNCAPGDGGIDFARDSEEESNLEFLEGQRSVGSEKGFHQDPATDRKIEISSGREGARSSAGIRASRGKGRSYRVPSPVTKRASHPRQIFLVSDQESSRARLEFAKAAAPSHSVQSEARAFASVARPAVKSGILRSKVMEMERVNPSSNGFPRLKAAITRRQTG
ncbi:hypothetical protein KM043_005683 [Ampulex compressa]|nr:hypothetical protein KM043_005683 [Ampulex compressa]